MTPPAPRSSTPPLGPLRRSCLDAAALMVAREDRPLAWNDRIALRLHLFACERCPRFAAQLRFMREAFGRWRASSGDPETSSKSSPLTKPGDSGA